jgi:hypothetical protein
MRRYIVERRVQMMVLFFGFGGRWVSRDAATRFSHREAVAVVARLRDLATEINDDDTVYTWRDVQ